MFEVIAFIFMLVITRWTWLDTQKRAMPVGVAILWTIAVLFFSVLAWMAYFFARREYPLLEAYSPQGVPTCTRCGAHTSADDKFCYQCGAEFSYDIFPDAWGSKSPQGFDLSSCGQCGAVSLPDAKFCMQCGEKFAYAYH